MTTTLRDRVHASLERTPITAVVRCFDDDDAARQAKLFISGGLELIEVTFTVPGAEQLVESLLEARDGDGPPFIGMGTVTTQQRAERAVAVGAEFLISPNTSEDVANVAKANDLFLVLGALSATEIVRAHELGSDIVKVFPLPPVGGASYLRAVRQPLSDIPMLASGGFAVDEIPTYAAAGATAFGIGSPMLGKDDAEAERLISQAIEMARRNVS